jgi:hypothetical protein
MVGEEKSHAQGGIRRRTDIPTGAQQHKEAGVLVGLSGSERPTGRGSNPAKCSGVANVSGGES